MKKFISSVIIATLVATSVFAQQKEAPKSPKVTVKSANVSITYGQPSKKGREIFGGLVPYGQVWRTGANEATEVTFKKVTKVGGQIVKPGTYTMFTIPQQNEWTIILNSKLKQWGAYEYEKNKNNDVLKVTAPSEKLTAPVEAFTITVTDNNITMQWDMTSVAVPLAVQ